MYNLRLIISFLNCKRPSNRWCLIVPRFWIGMETFVMSHTTIPGANCVNSTISKNWGIWCRCCIALPLQKVWLDISYWCQKVCWKWQLFRWGRTMVRRAHVVKVNCTLWWTDSTLDNNVVGMAKCSSQSNCLDMSLASVEAPYNKKWVWWLGSWNYK